MRAVTAGLIMLALLPTTLVAKPAAKPKPPAALAEEFGKRCSWREVRGAGVSMWHYACPESRLIADPTVPGISIEQPPQVDGGKREFYPLVRLFRLKAGAPVATILPAVLVAAGVTGADAADCVLVPDKGTLGHFTLEPKGALLARYKNTEAADWPSEPCGALGPTEAGTRFLWRVPGSTTLIAAIALPSDIPTFDWRTLKAAR